MIIENITTVLNWKGVPGIQYKILYENWIMRINLNRNIFNIIAAIAPADESLNNFTMIIQNKQNIKNNGQEITISNPRKEATPFPPLNFNQIGNMWPSIEKLPQTVPRSLP